MRSMAGGTRGRIKVRSSGTRGPAKKIVSVVDRAVVGVDDVTGPNRVVVATRM